MERYELYSPVSSSVVGRFARRVFLAVLLALALAGCGAEQNTTEQNTPEESTAARSAPEQSTPEPEKLPPAAEPAEAPPLQTEPAGRVVRVGSMPEGIVADPETGFVALGVRDPDALALIDGESGEVVRSVGLPAPLRHLQLAAPGGPVLVPDERSNTLLLVGLPDGEVISKTPVGEFPHDAAAAGDRIFTTNEFGDTSSVVEDGRVIKTLQVPIQPGGVAVSGDAVGVLGVRGLALEVFDADTLRSLGEVDAGEGPTHLVAGPDDRFYVADTRGDAILVFEAAPKPKLIDRVSLPGAPYGLAIDPERNHLWVTLTAENRVVRLDLNGDEPREVSGYPTVRQPNTVAVDPESGRVYVAGRAEGELQILAP